MSTPGSSHHTHPGRAGTQALGANRCGAQESRLSARCGGSPINRRPGLQLQALTRGAGHHAQRARLNLTLHSHHALAKPDAAPRSPSAEPNCALINS